MANITIVGRYLTKDRRRPIVTGKLTLTPPVLQPQEDAIKPINASRDGDGGFSFKAVSSASPLTYVFIEELEGVTRQLSLTIPADVAGELSITALAGWVAPTHVAIDAPVPRSPRPGSLLAVAIGDSTTMGDSIHPAGFPYNANGTGQLADGSYPPVGPFEFRQGPRSWFHHACWGSKGRLRPLFNAGQGTDQTPGMLKRFQADVLAKAPDLVFVGDARNDLGNIPEATTRTNILTMIDRAQAAGITVALVTAYPDSNSGTATLVRRHNAWLRKVAQERRLILCDKYAAVVDPASATGAYLPAMTSDGTHTTYAGAAAAGARVLADLGGLLSGTSDWLPTNNVQDTNLLGQPLFQAAGGGWYVNGSAGTIAYETDAANYAGRAAVVTFTGADRFSNDVNMASRGISVGQRLKWVGLARVQNAVAGTLRWNLEIAAPGNGTYVVRPVETTASGMDMAWFQFDCEFVVPAGATTVRVGANVVSGTGAVSLAQQGLYNLDAIGT
jgi:lysophospholipase L1-like esterase